MKAERTSHSSHSTHSSGSGKSEKSEPKSKSEKSEKPEKAERSGSGEKAEQKERTPRSADQGAREAGRKSQEARADAQRDEQRADAERSQREQKTARERAAVAATPQMKAHRGESSFEEAKAKDPVTIDPAKSRSAQPVKPEDARTHAEVEQTLSRSEEGRKTLEAMKRHDLGVEYADGGGSRHEDGKLVIDRSQGSTEAALEMVHEANHAVADKTGQSPDPTKVEQQEYVDRMIKEEAKGTAAAIETKRQLAQQGVDVSGTDIEMERQYSQARNRAIEEAAARNEQATEEDLAAAGRAAGEARVEEGMRNGEVITSNTGETYPNYYARNWQEVRDAVAAGKPAPDVIEPDPRTNPNAPVYQASPSTPINTRSRIGINDNWGTDRTAIGDGNIEAMKASFRDDAALGAHETRITFNVDPQRGLLDPSGQHEATVDDYKPLFDAAKEAGLEVDAVFMPANVVNNRNMGDYTNNGKAWGEKVGEVAKQMKEKYGVTSFEVGNEPNEGMEPKGDQFPNGKYFETVQAQDRNDPQYRDHEQYAAQAYMKYLDPAYDAIKQKAGQDTKVAMAGISYVTQGGGDRFLKDLYEAGLKDNTDAVNIHPYGLGDKADTDNVRDNLMRIQSVMYDYGDTDHKLWVTEAGTQTDGSPASEARQAAYLEDFVRNLPDNVEKAHVFSKTDYDGTYGVTYTDGRHKDSWDNLQSAITADTNAAQTRAARPRVAPELGETQAHWSSMLGNPRGPETRENGTIRQDFENGSIVRDESGYHVYTRLGAQADGQIPRTNAGGGVTIDFQNGTYTYDLGGDITVTMNNPNAEPTAVADPMVNARQEYGFGPDDVRGAPYYEPFSQNMRQELKNGGYLVSDPFGAVHYEPPRPQ